MVNQPDFSSLEIEINGVKSSQMVLRDFSQILYMENGRVVWQYSLVDNGGRITNVVIERFLSMADRQLAAIRIRLRPENYSGEIGLQLKLDCDVENLPISDNQMQSNIEMLRLWDNIAVAATADGGVLTASTLYSKKETAMAFKVISDKQVYETRQIIETKSVGIALKAYVDKGQVWQVDKLIAVSCIRDIGNPKKQAIEKLEQKCCSYEEMLLDSTRVWKNIWQDTDVEIEGDDSWQGAIRYNIFQLLQTAPEGDERASIGARGLMHGRYKGCYFWDTEIFMLPFFTNTRPDTARSLLMYRYNTLQDAVKSASGFSSKGARYSWMASDTGFEQCETWDTGCCEVHITADIAYAIGNYIDHSGNTCFLKDYGAEILLQTARYWADRFSYSREEDCYHLLFVKGPDEYCGVTVDDFYTVRMAVNNLKLAIKAAEYLSDKFPERWRELKEKLKLQDEELSSWQDIAEKTVQRFDEKRNLWLQDATFEYLEPLDVQKHKTDCVPLYKKISFDRLQRYQVLKQPAVLMYMALFPQEFSRKEMEGAWNYYVPKTLHDSTLSFGIHAMLAAMLGREEEAVSYFEKSLFLDLKDVMNNTAGEGIHTASLGATWQALVYGFGGIYIKDGRLCCRPHLPRNIKRMKFSIMYLGQRYTVLLDGKDTEEKILSIT